MRHRWQIMLAGAGAGAVAVSLLAGAPATHAVFARTLNAGTTSVGTYTLAAPTGNNVVPSCTPIGASGKYRMNITVIGHGTVEKATHYVLTVRNAAGVTQSTTTLTPLGSYSNNNAAKGWGYSIEAQYRTSSTLVKHQCFDHRLQLALPLICPRTIDAGDEDVPGQSKSLRPGQAPRKPADGGRQAFMDRHYREDVW